MPANEHERRDALPRGTALRDYTIETVLGHGGFGIVYRARHNELGGLVAIKEYLPVESALRDGAAVHARSAACRADYEDGLRRFLEEAKALIGFRDHPSIVSCRDFFRANGTAYLVMEHEDGLPLSVLLQRREAAGRPFAEADLLAVMVPLLEGLARVHEAGALHRDIKPSNILVRRADERPVLIDFGAAKQGAAERSKSMAPYTEGYAALEQVGEGELGPWTDLYAAGAVMWRMAAGGNPPWEPPNPVKVEKRANAALRGGADPLPPARELGAGRFSPGVLEAIDRCLQLSEKERVRDCRELLGLLREAGAVEKAAVAAPQARGGRRPRRMLTAVGVVLAAALAWLALASWNGPTPVSREAEAGAAGGSMQDAVLARAAAQWNAVRDTRDAEAARAYIEEYGGVEGAGVWVKLAESLLAELDREDQAREAQTRAEEQNREAVRRKEAAREAWNEVRDARDAEAARAYIEEYGGVEGAGVWVGQAEALLAELDREDQAREAWNEVRDARDVEAARAYIEEYRGVEGAGEWIKLAESLLAELDREDQAREAWNEVRDARDAEAARAYIEEYEGVEGAGVWVGQAESLLAELDRERRVREAAENERKAREAERSRPGRRFRDCAECPQMVVIPAGSFMMGSPESEYRAANEVPAHRVEIGEPFAVGAYEVTFEEWDTCVAAGGCAGYRPADRGWGRGKRPVIHVSWKDAQAYVEWLSGKTGEKYRLLSEAEWEYAARGGSRTRYSFGDDISRSQANYDFNGSNGLKKTVPVGSYGANGFGLYDMHGNLWEWVQDCWNDHYGGAPADGRAWESGNCSRGVLRGGSWSNIPWYLRSASRLGIVTGIRSLNYGFRVARTLGP